MTELDNIYINEPFPHCVIDNFLDSTMANKLYEEINSLKLENANCKFTNIKDPNQYNKFAFSQIEKLPLSLKNVFAYLNKVLVNLT